MSNESYIEKNANKKFKSKQNIDMFKPKIQDQEEDDQQQDNNVRQSVFRSNKVGDDIEEQAKLLKKKEYEKIYRKLTLIIDSESMHSYIKICVGFESIFLFYYAYNLIIGFNDITQFAIAFLYLIDYIISLFNLLLYLRYLIQYKNENKAQSSKLHDLLRLSNKKNLIIQNKIYKTLSISLKARIFISYQEMTI